ncbi:hypothetical protein FGB62_50g07 [Gracilaria domingensis]|nr:hypothetical protein FGB62_50g07 [Gracilaria domingensis]
MGDSQDHQRKSCDPKESFCASDESACACGGMLIPAAGVAIAHLALSASSFNGIVTKLTGQWSHIPFHLTDESEPQMSALVGRREISYENALRA